MAQGQFTKEEAQHVRETVEDLFKGLSKKKQPEYIGHLNDIFLFLKAAESVAPNEPPQYVAPSEPPKK